MAFKTATVQSGQVTGTHSDFPVYVDLSRLGITTLAEAQSVRVYSDEAKTVELPREIVSLSECHVKVTSLSSTTELFIDYDGVRSDYATTATYGAENVWTNGYAAVYHMQETSGSIIDSTGNGHDGTGVSTMPNAIAGKVGGAQDFNGSSYIDTNDDFADGASELTLSCWVKPDNFNLFNAMIMKHHGGTPRAWGFQLQTDGQIRFQLFYSNGSNSSLDSGSGFKAIAASWNYVTGTYDDAANSRAVYLNGTQANTDSPTLGMQNDSSNVTLGAYENGANKLNGQMDEVRIATAERTSNWITTEYNNQNDEATFWGTWTDAGGGGGGGAAQAARRGAVMMM